MIKGFEYVDTGNVITELSQAVDAARYILARVESDTGTLSPDAFIWGMEGRRVDTTTAQETLRYFEATRQVEIDEAGQIMLQKRQSKRSPRHT